MINTLFNPQQKRNLIFSSISFVVIIIIISIIVILNTSSTKIIGNNNIPKRELSQLKTQLTNFINDRYNTSNKDLNIEIREDTYKESESNGIIAANFLVDIPSIEQTFSVDVSWSKKDKKYNDDFSISCPSEEQSNYPNSICITEANSSYNYLSEYLPYYGDINGKSFTISEGYSDNSPILKVSINSCGNKTIQDAALSAAKEYIRTISKYPEKYNYYVIPNLCDGEAG